MSLEDLNLEDALERLSKPFGAVQSEKPNKPRLSKPLSFDQFCRQCQALGIGYYKRPKSTKTEAQALQEGGWRREDELEVLQTDPLFDIEEFKQFYSDMLKQDGKFWSETIARSISLDAALSMVKYEMGQSHPKLNEISVDRTLINRTIRYFVAHQLCSYLGLDPQLALQERSNKAKPPSTQRNASSAKQNEDNEDE